MRKLRYRAGPIGAIGAAALAIGLGGCHNNDPGGGGTPNIALAPATTSGSYSTPLDSVPDSTAKTFYFVALDTAAITDPKTESKTGNFGVFSVPAAGGAAVKLASGSPFSAPFGISISDDDKTLFIADRAAGRDPNDDTKSDAPGAIFALSTGGGVPSVLSGTSGYGPRALHVVGDQIWFTGVDPADGQVGVFKIGSGGGTPSAVIKGAPLSDPSGITVLASGDAYVADSLSGSGDSSRAHLVKISGGAASEFVGKLSLGFPAGLDATMDGTKLLVSAQDVATGGSVVNVIDLSTKAVTSFNQGIETSTDSGGLHRAKSADILSWCGVTAGGQGTVFQVTLK